MWWYQQIWYFQSIMVPVRYSSCNEHFHAFIRTCSVVELSRMLSFIQSFHSTLWAIQLETLLRRLPLLITSSILPHRLLRRRLVLLKVLDLIRTHKLAYIVRLKLLEAKSKPFMAIILVVRLKIVSKMNSSVSEV